MSSETWALIRRLQKRVVRLLAGVCLVLATSYVAFYLLHVNTLVAGFAYVLVVLVAAARWGLVESVVTSIAAVLCLDFYFLPPILSLTIADPQN